MKRFTDCFFLLPLFFLSTGFFRPISGFCQTGTEGGYDERKPKAAFQEIRSPEIPEKLYFAGEEVPMWNFDVFESLDRELTVNCFFHSQTLRYIKLAPRFFEIIEPILKQDTVPDDFKYLALAESGFDPRALSPAGAAGIWQFMKPAAREYGLEINEEIDERYHIEKATHAACQYLKE
ncbi:MAG TPA: lytic transglycosylase domain-containing protein, partial [Prolixibacteraceae bacterium]|nr:lytic transglycosylase domain-containing protein [Prolixibacteraceae bacterium]